MSHDPREKPRRLPYAVSPLAGEPIDSWVRRLAVDLFSSPRAVLSACGVLSPAALRRPSNLHVRLSRSELSNLASATGVSRPRIRATLLASYDGGPVDLGAVPSPEESGRFLARHEWVYVTDSHFCPACLEERGGAWKVSWKVAFSACCARHRVLLADRCPACERRPGLAAGDKARLSPLVGDDPIAEEDILVCDQRPWRRRKCTHHLSVVATAGATPAMVAAQEAVDRALAGEAVAGADMVLARRSFFAGLRSACALLLAVAEPQDLLADLGDANGALHTHVEARNTRGRRDRRGRSPWSPAPKRAALVASVLPDALALVLAADGERAERLGQLTDRARRAGLSVRSEQPLTARFRFPRELADRRRSRIAAASRRSGRLGLLLGSASEAPRVDPGRVPQALWPLAHQRLFHPLIEDWPGELARRYCSLALLRVGGQPSWDAAASALGLDNISGKGTAVHFTARLERSGRADDFVNRLHRLASLLAAHPSPIDYAARRERLRGLTRLEDREWRPLVAGTSLADLSAARGEDRGRRHLAAWAWAAITCGSWRASPACRAHCLRRYLYLHDVRAVSTDPARAAASLRALFLDPWEPAGIDGYGGLPAAVIRELYELP